MSPRGTGTIADLQLAETYYLQLIFIIKYNNGFCVTHVEGEELVSVAAEHAVLL